MSISFEYRASVLISKKYILASLRRSSNSYDICDKNLGLHTTS